MKDAVLTCAAIKARENFVENTVLALQAMLLREKMVLINIYKAYFLARPIASLHDNRPPVHFPLSAAAWCVGGAQIAVNEQTPRSCAVAFVFYLFILNFSFDKSMTMRHC